MTKKQHYLPQFYLDNFTNNKGKLWIYDQLKRNIFTSSPRDIACENYLYETRWENANPDLGDFVLPNQIEKKFAEQEGRYSKLLKRIVSICTNTQNKKALICNREEKEILASFISNIYLRNPWSMRQADLDCVTDGIMDVKEIKDIDKMLQLMEFGGMESLVKCASKMVWLDENFNGSVQQEAKRDLLGVKFCIMIAEKGQFITSSYPVLCGINEMSVEEDKVIYCPLHPKIALLYSDTLPRKSKNRMVLMSEDAINCCNARYFKLGKEQLRFVYAKEKMILEQIIKRNEYF